MSVQADKIPLELRRRPQWVIWRYETREGRQTKAPFMALEPAVRASSTRADTWAPFEAALAAYLSDTVNIGGIGFVFTPDDPFCGVDIDPDLAADSQSDIMERLASYTESSPSGRGFHVIIRAGALDKGRHPPGIGIFTSGRYFTFTGAHVSDTPLTVEERQAELAEILEEYLPIVSPNGSNGHHDIVPVDLEDAELIEKARQARRGIEFDALMRGEWEFRYSSQSEADLALCSKLAFWTGRDGARIDRIFRASGLMREKWNRDDYREATIAEAIAGCRDIYTLKRERHDKDELHDPVPEERPPDTAPLVIKFETAREFAAVDEPSAESIIGVPEETCLLSRGGSILFYGKGGAGKTTLEIDFLAHLAAGKEWLGLPVYGRTRILVIENEGPRGMFRRKIRKKLEGWEGDDSFADDELHFLAEPWALVDFSKEEYREQIALGVRASGINLIAAGPVQALGMPGGGTPEEVGLFVWYLDLIRQTAGTDIAFLLPHHENKGGDVSGAWGGRTDTVAHVHENGQGSTRVHWEKVRWGEKMHQADWQLNWREGQSFELAEKAETMSEAEYETALLEYAERDPGCSWRTMREAVGDNTRAQRVRDRLLRNGKLVNRGTEKYMKLALGASEPGLWEE